MANDEEDRKWKLSGGSDEEGEYTYNSLLKPTLTLWIKIPTKIGWIF